MKPRFNLGEIFGAIILMFIGTIILTLLFKALEWVWSL